MTTPIRSLTLERFLLGELPEAERAALDQALAADPGLRARLDELRASNLETTERYRASVVSREIRERSLNRRHDSRKALRLNLALAGALATAVVLIGFSPRGLAPTSLPTDNLGTETIQTKGPASALRVFRKTAVGSEPLVSGSRAAKGDLLRLGYQATRGRYGLIVSVDGRNNLTRHWPRQGETAALMQTGGLMLLDQAFELDDAPRFERFYLVTSDHTFAVEAVVRALREGGSPAAAPGPRLPADLELSKVEIHKEPFK